MQRTIFSHLLFCLFIMFPSVCYLVFLYTELTSSIFCTTTHVIAGSSVSLLCYAVIDMIAWLQSTDEKFAYRDSYLSLLVLILGSTYD